MQRKLLLSCVLSGIIIVVLSSAFTQITFAKDGLFLGSKRFGEHTYIGPFDISDMKEEKAKNKVNLVFNEIREKVEVNLIYQDIQFDLPTETITFKVDMTLANAQSGKDNPIIATVSREGLRTVFNQQLPWSQFPENIIDSIATGIETELQSGIMPRSIYITDYLGNEIQDEVLASTEYSIEGISPMLSKAILALDQSTIQSFESFSIREWLKSSGVEQLTDKEMTLLSSILYRAVLQTNFLIDERNISTALSSDIQPGYEAAMNQTLGLDFKFTNPNKTEFTIRADWSAGAIYLSIEGRPFYYTYEPAVTNIETYNPRIIRQYSAFVDDGQVVVSQDGKQGMEVIVKRTLSVDGQVVDTEDISEDFYAPIHRIEILPLSKVDASLTVNSDSEGSTNTQDGGSNSGLGTETVNPEGTESNDLVNVHDTVNEELNSGELIYDKSGLPISEK